MSRPSVVALAVAYLFAVPAFAGDPIAPDPKLTPGAVASTDAGEICRPGYAKAHRHARGKLKALIYRDYGIDKGRGHYEVDHLIPLSIGGADVAANLWPESFDTQPWNPLVKDRLEVRLRDLVCSGRMPIEQAQRGVATDWSGAYRRYARGSRDF